MFKFDTYYRIIHIINDNKISNNFNPAEYDVLLSSGEQASCALIAARLNHIGFKSRSWMSWQIPILTEGNYSYSRITFINKKKNY